jgi:hypothetical protein
MPESQSEFDVRILRFKFQNLENQLQSAVSELRAEAVRLADRIAALEQGFGATIKVPRKARTNPDSNDEPGFDGI